MEQEGLDAIKNWKDYADELLPQEISKDSLKARSRHLSCNATSDLIDVLNTQERMFTLAEFKEQLKNIERNDVCATLDKMLPELLSENGNLYSKYSL